MAVLRKVLQSACTVNSLTVSLSDLLEIAAVLEHLFPMELLLGHILHFVDMP